MENELLNQVLVFATVLTPILSAIVELLKKTFSLRKNLLPLLSVIVGLVVGLLAYPFTELDLVLRLWAGGLAGLAGTGLFELVKHREGYTK